jgi:hypothetical protein
MIVTDEDPDDVERHDSDNDYDYSEELGEQRLVCGR